MDIGSNSVRLVIYDRMKRVPRPLFNEKALCGLGQGLHRSGTLDAEAKAFAEASVARFVAIARMMGVGELHAVATAAVRDAKDGAAFIRKIEKNNGVKIRIISGEEEAYFAAQGVISSIHAPRGLVADFGGGSLELVEVSEKGILRQSTLPIGALRLLGMCNPDPDAIRARLRKELGKVAWLGKGYDRLYAIGGGFRSIARVHMERFDYPLRLLHHYAIETEPLRPFFTHLLGMTPKERARIQGLQNRRADGFLPAVVALEEIIRAARAERVIFSAAGIREGLLFDKLPAEEHARDALTASMDALTGEAWDSSYADALFAWQKPLFAGEPQERERLRRAACSLSEIALAVSPDFRAEWAFEHILVAALYGITHRERVTLALALYHRYRAKKKLRSKVLELIHEEDEAWARLVGQSMGLAFDLSAGIGELLGRFAVTPIGGGAIGLQGDAEARKTVPATVEKRLEGLGETLRAFRKSRK